MTSRLYHLVMYNLSPIQKGIQAGHSALEYSRNFGTTSVYQDFIANHKTWIILDGGGSIEMESHVQELSNMGIPHSFFKEPDLNDSISAISFLVTENIYEGQKTREIDGKCPEMYFYPDGTSMIKPDETFFKFLKQFKLAK